MATNQRTDSLTMLLVGALLLVPTGCRSKSDSDSQSSNQPQLEQPVVQSSGETEDHLTVARRRLSLKQWDLAAEAAYKALVQDPDSREAMLAAAEAEAGRANHETAVELASAIDLEWRLAEKAVNIHARSLYELNRTSDSADVLLAGLEKLPQQSLWRHRAWGLLSRVGRREEAAASGPEDRVRSER